MPRAKSATKIAKRRPAAAKAKAVSVWHDVLPSRSEQREMKREALLRAAVSAFNRRGFSQTSLDEIAQNLGVTKAALYYYFPTKSALVAACFDRAMKVANESLAIAKRRRPRRPRKADPDAAPLFAHHDRRIERVAAADRRARFDAQRSRQADRAARHFRARAAHRGQGRHRRRQHRVVRSQARRCSSSSAPFTGCRNGFRSKAPGATHRCRSRSVKCSIACCRPFRQRALQTASAIFRNPTTASLSRQRRADYPPPALQLLP